MWRVVLDVLRVHLGNTVVTEQDVFALASTMNHSADTQARFGAASGLEVPTAIAGHQTTGDLRMR